MSVLGLVRSVILTAARVSDTHVLNVRTSLTRRAFGDSVGLLYFTAHLSVLAEIILDF